MSQEAMPLIEKTWDFEEELWRLPSKPTLGQIKSVKTILNEISMGLDDLVKG